MSTNYQNCNSSSCNSIMTSCSNCDFSIKQGDNCPSFKIQIKDTSTGNSVSFKNWIVETYMYFYSYFKSIEQYGEYSGYDYYILNLLGNQNICQIKIGDIIGVEDCNQNLQEFMFVNEIDGNDIYVIRGYGESDIYEHKRGDKLIFYRIYNKEGFVTSQDTEEDYEENFESEGQNNEKITEDFSIIGYSWDIEDTSHKGIYFLELKVKQVLLEGEGEGKIRTFPIKSDGYKIIIY